MGMRYARCEVRDTDMGYGIWDGEWVRFAPGNHRDREGLTSYIA